MTKDELYLNINNYNFESLVCQSNIQSAADIEKYRSQGYFCVNWTKDDFTKLFGVDTDKVFYTTSIGTSSLYFNRDTLAAMPLNLEYLQLKNSTSRE